MSARKRAIARRFGAAAPHYDRFAGVQRLAASRLAGHIVRSGLPDAPRVLEIGCGTGLLTGYLADALPNADWTVTDLSPEMLLQCRARFAFRRSMRFLAMDAERPSVRPGFDLICANLALQWCDDLAATLRGLAALLGEGGLLAVTTLAADSFSIWREAMRAETGSDPAPRYPTLDALREGALDALRELGLAGGWQAEILLDHHASGIEFLRGLRAIGADLQHPGAVPLDPLAMRRVLRRFEAGYGATADYQVATGLFRRPAQPGVFVAGTDTGVGKTVVSACLVSAWGARYWKPLQTGLRDEPGDTGTVIRLAGLSAGRVIAPAYEFQAPLSPEAAALSEGASIDFDALDLPPRSKAPLVVEGAGGLLVPIAPGRTMIDLIGRLALPVVLVARGTLGTINHTLLSIEALRARGVPIAGVIINGPATAANREAIARHGKVRILAALPALETVDAQEVTRLAALIPPFDPAADERTVQ